MSRYRLPEVLGGGGVERAIGSDVPNGWIRVLVQGEDESFPMDLPATALIEIRDPIPPEPPNFSVVWIGVRAHVRDDDPRGGGDWWGESGRTTWEALCRIAYDRTGSPPVPLVPDPFAEPVELPWEGIDAAIGRERLEIRAADSDGHVPVIIPGVGAVYLTRDDSRTAARALWAAADAAEVAA